ncbi:MAG: DUF1249 domain-containing protein [Pseudomonadota bacterium]
MQPDSLIVPQTLVKPRSFAGLMSVYESNFIRLTRLVPELHKITGTACSHSDADLPLHLDVIERTRYTCTLQLTYLFAGDDDQLSPVSGLVDVGQTGALLADPDLRLRVYFDGHLAEVMSLTSNHRHAVLRRIAASHSEELDLRWRRNMMLNKWLEFCLDAGHQLVQSSPD